MRVVKFGLFLILLLPASVFAQEALLDKGRTLYSKEISGGITLHGEGWGLHFVHGTYKTAKVRNLLYFEVVGMKHPKEVKSYNPFYEDSRGYFYGKQNSVMFFRAGIGRKIQLTDKLRKSGVEVNMVWAAGPTIALIKPVYLQIGYYTNEQGDLELGFPYEVVIDERYDPEVHYVDNIFGRSSWFRGFGEMGITPGASARFGLNFEYDSENAGIRALEAGLTTDVFAKEIPIMAEGIGNTNKQIFFGFYVGIQLGKKYTR
jgi:hypothetical protein